MFSVFLPHHALNVAQICENGDAKLYAIAGCSAITNVGAAFFRF